MKDKVTCTQVYGRSEGSGMLRERPHLVLFAHRAKRVWLVEGRLWAGAGGLRVAPTLSCEVEVAHRHEQNDCGSVDG